VILSDSGKSFVVGLFTLGVSKALGLSLPRLVVITEVLEFDNYLVDAIALINEFQRKCSQLLQKHAIICRSASQGSIGD
jgi:hypothetical protein